MKIVSILSVCTVLVAVADPSLANKTIRNADEPVNLPPESYSGLQFVDNNGCVFVRSGYQGRVTWVPRVDRRRRQLCNKDFTPTFGPTVVAAAEEEPETQKPFKKLSERLNASKQSEATAEAEAKVEAVEPAQEEVVVQSSTEKPAVVQPEPQGANPSALETGSGETKLVTDKPKNPLVALLTPKPKTLKADAVEEPVEVAEPEPVAKEVVEATEKAVEPAVETKPKKNIFEQLKSNRAARVDVVKEPVEVAVSEPKPKPKVVVEEPALTVPTKPVVKPKPVKTAKAEVGTVKKTVVKLKSGSYVRIGKFSDPARAKATSALFQGSGFKTATDADGALLVGPFRSGGSAKAALYQARGSGFPKASVVTR